MAWQRPTRGAPGLIMGPCIVEIDRIVIRYVQYQFEVSRCRNEEFIVKGNFGWAWSMWARAPQDVRYQFEVNWLKGNFGWAGAPQELNYCNYPGLVMGPYIVEIDRIVIGDVQYQFEVLINGCRNEEVIGWFGRGVPARRNFGWAWSMRAGRPRIDRIVIRDVQYQFKVNGCRNEEVNFQGSSAYSVGGDSGQDGRTDRRRR
ncbi:hypothetical protein DPMN_096187 [Dreissena polymorpha]|uniref:Uncharacterized protein n=1 Tax=Dreissena polymorpha TaxID=45954 RepID=A0A9D4L7V8_DREPO|nr:hypothetical protein DPMN_096187 [Dreissena polymorpha]